MDGIEGKKDELKGRAKEAAGDLTDDEELKAEGKTDKVAGKVKQGLEDAKRKGEETVEAAKEKLRRR